MLLLLLLLLTVVWYEGMGAHNHVASSPGRFFANIPARVAGEKYVFFARRAVILAKNRPGDEANNHGAMKYQIDNEEAHLKYLLVEFEELDACYHCKGPSREDKTDTCTLTWYGIISTN